MEQFQHDHLSMPLQVDDISGGYLKEIIKWSKFLSIVGFVVTGIIAIFAIFAGSLFASLSFPRGESLTGGVSILITILYLGFAVLNFFPCLYLFKFSNKAKQALELNAQESFNEAFGNLKSCFKFIGITTLVFLSLYALIFIFGILAGMLTR